MLALDEGTTPACMLPIIDLRKHIRGRGAYGGRGGLKTALFAKQAIRLAVMLMHTRTPLHFICARQYQTSIRDSVFTELVTAIERLQVGRYFKITRNTLSTRNDRIRFVFLGLHDNPQSIKSYANIRIMWIEEAEYVHREAWDLLIRTVRMPGSEIWATWNPESPESPVYEYFVKNPRPGWVAVKTGWRDNPWFSHTALAAEREWDSRHLSPERYAWIWEGEFKRQSEDMVFPDRVEFDDVRGMERRPDTEYLFGVDWGFSEDPTVLTRSLIKDNILYVDYAAYGYRVPNTALAELFRSVPGSDRWPLYADSSRPETIHYMQQQGFNIRAAKKWPGSVEDGISHLRGYDRIVADQQLQELRREFALYSYKKDRYTGAVLPVIVDAHNHGLDALRYSLDGRIRKTGFGWLV